MAELTTHKRTAVALIVFSLLLVACGAQEAAAPSMTPAPTSSPVSESTPSLADSTPSPEPTSVVPTSTLIPERTLTPRLPRPSWHPGPHLLVSVVDEEGNPLLEGGAVLNHTEYRDYAARDRSWSTDGFPARMEVFVNAWPATESFRVVTSDGRVSDTVVFQASEWQDAKLDAISTKGNEHYVVAAYEFDLGKTGAFTEVKIVTMDMLPGDETNCVAARIGPGGSVPVAILTTPRFNAADVDVSSLTLRAALSKATGHASDDVGRLEDVDGDGDLDLVVEFPVDDVQLTDADETVILDGLTKTGDVLQATDPGCIGSRLLVRVVDVFGRPVVEGTVEISIEHAVHTESNLENSFDLARWRGRIPVIPGASWTLAEEGDEPTTISVRVVTSDERVSDTLVLSGTDWRIAVQDRNMQRNDIVAVHEFELGKAGQTTELKLMSMNLDPRGHMDCIDPASEGTVSAVHSTSRYEYDAGRVEVSSLTLRGLTAGVKVASNYADSSLDLPWDMTVKLDFPNADLQLTDADEVVVLEGFTQAGVPIQATDTVCHAEVIASTVGIW